MININRAIIGSWMFRVGLFYLVTDVRIQMNSAGSAGELMG